MTEELPEPVGAHLHLWRGLPGSGKTTQAKRMVADAAHPWVVRVNRDDLRRMLHGRFVGSLFHERLVTMAQAQMVKDLLVAQAVVCVDDTNLDDAWLEPLLAAAEFAGAQVHVHDLRDVPLATCLKRNASRWGTDGFIGPDVITRMHERYIEPLGL